MPPQLTPQRTAQRTARRIAAVVTAAVLAAPVVAHAESGRKVETWATPGPTAVTITGHGFGHGKGMSQYGALGAAQQGLSWQQIIDFYYPGTTWSTLGGSIKVKITADTNDDVVVVSQSGLKVTRLAPRRTWTLSTKAARMWRLAPKNNSTLVQWRARRGGWRTWKSLAGEAELNSTSRRLTLVTPTGRTTYRGRLRSAMPTPGSSARDTVNILSLEAYLRGVVPGEVPAEWPQNAVSAQSVAARTYAAFERAYYAKRYYHVCDTSACQVYGGADAEHPAADAAIKATAKQILTYGGQPAFTQFSASNGGWSAAGSTPYLVAQQDPYDSVANPKYSTWVRTLTDADVEKHYPAIGDLTSIEVTARDGGGDWGGRVSTMSLVGSTGRADITGDRLRDLLGLSSTYFTFSVAPAARWDRG